MITVQEAKQQILAHCHAGPVGRIPLVEAVERILARDLIAPFDLPLFPASAMDGYAMRFADAADASPDHPVTLRLVGIIAAGDGEMTPLQPGETYRIMTGAMIPPGVTAVVPQENVVAANTASMTLDRPVVPNAHIRWAGEDVRAGAVALPQGTVLTPAAIGFCAALGLADVEVMMPPRVTIIPTGSELISAGMERGPGKIYESNATMLRAALTEFGIAPIMVPPVADTSERLQTLLREALETSDIVMVTGGVSVGQYDLVRTTAEAIGVEPVFWKVAQKPGKPLYFGHRDKTLFFGLPGNPAASLSCYYLYVRPALCRWLGHTDLHLPTAQAQLTAPCQTKGKRTHFLRGRASVRDGALHVTAHPTQGSHCLQSFATANCLLEIPEGSLLDTGDAVTIHWLPLTCHCEGAT